MLPAPCSSMLQTAAVIFARPLYFYASPNADSIAPAVEYFRKDEQSLIGNL